MRHKEPSAHTSGYYHDPSRSTWQERQDPPVPSPGGPPSPSKHPYFPCSRPKVPDSQISHLRKSRHRERRTCLGSHGKSGHHWDQIWGCPSHTPSLPWGWQVGKHVSSGTPLPLNHHSSPGYSPDPSPLTPMGALLHPALPVWSRTGLLNRDGPYSLLSLREARSPSQACCHAWNSNICVSFSQVNHCLFHQGDTISPLKPRGKDTLLPCWIGPMPSNIRPMRIRQGDAQEAGVLLCPQGFLQAGLCPSEKQGGSSPRWQLGTGLCCLCSQGSSLPTPRVSGRAGS